METLRIKCPSCGIVLEVKNSKNEPVKRITCPNCQKLLAVTFSEPKPASPTRQQAPLGTLYYGKASFPLHEGVNQIDVLTSGYVEVKAARSADRTGVCTVRALRPDVLLNDAPLDVDDEVVLAKGDELKVDDVVLTFNQQGNQPGTSVKSGNNVVPPGPKSEPKRVPTWLLGCVALGALIAVVLLWPQKTTVVPPNPPTQTDISKPADQGNKETANEEKVHHDSNAKNNVGNKEKKKIAPPAEKPVDISQLNPFELEKLAAKGDVQAQYLLGRRKAAAGDSANIILGLNYLKRARNGGSSDASSAIQALRSRLQQRAARGSSVAENILKEQTW